MLTGTPNLLTIGRVLALPEADLLPLNIGIVEHTVRPTVGLDGLEPDVGILIIRIGHGLRMPGLADTLRTA